MVHVLSSRPGQLSVTFGAMVPLVLGFCGVATTGCWYHIIHGRPVSVQASLKKDIVL